VSIKPTGAPLTPPCVPVWDTAVQTPSSDYMIVVKEGFIAPGLQPFKGDCRYEESAARNSPASQPAHCPLPGHVLWNARSHKANRPSAWFLPVMPNAVPQAVSGDVAPGLFTIILLIKDPFILSVFPGFLLPLRYGIHTRKTPLSNRSH
jgi:hypothetical protein